MGKGLLIFLGVLLLLAAGGMFAYRQLGPSMEQAAYRDAGPEARGARDLDRPELARRDSGERDGGGGWRTAEIVIDVLNAVLGVVGIVLALFGFRMQRQAQSQSQSMTMGDRRK